jgi:hypothetical protein
LEARALEVSIRPESLDTWPLRRARILTLFHVGGLPGRDQATDQTEKSADERFNKIVAP